MTGYPRILGQWRPQQNDPPTPAQVEAGNEWDIYVDAVLAAFGSLRTLARVRPWLTTYCTECDTNTRDMGEEDRNAHVLVDAGEGGLFVAVGCEGYWLVNPVALEIDSSWDDWTAYDTDDTAYRSAAPPPSPLGPDIPTSPLCALTNRETTP